MAGQCNWTLVFCNEARTAPLALTVVASCTLHRGILSYGRTLLLPHPWYLLLNKQGSVGLSRKEISGSMTPLTNNDVIIVEVYKCLP